MNDRADRAWQELAVGEGGANRSIESDVARLFLGVEDEAESGGPAIRWRERQTGTWPRFLSEGGEECLVGSEALAGKWDGNARDEGFAAKTELPAGGSQCRVETVQKGTFAFETDEEIGVGEIVTVREDSATWLPIGLNDAVGVAALVCSTSGLVVNTWGPFKVDPDTHLEDGEVVDRLIARPAKRGAEETDDTAL